MIYFIRILVFFKRRAETNYLEVDRFAPVLSITDATGNQYYRFKATIKSDLAEFEKTIMQDVLAFQSIQNMLHSNHVLLTADNKGCQTLLNISHEETRKSQAKLKRIAREHFLFCMLEKISSGILN